MELIYIIGAVVLLIVIASLSTGKGKNTKRTSKTQSRSALKVSDYIPKEKNDEEVWCSESMGLEIINRFVQDIGAHEKAANLYRSEFSLLINETRENLQLSLKKNDNNLKSHLDHYEGQVNEILNSENDEEYIQSEVSDTKDEMKEIRKSHKKADRWINNNVKKLQNDCRKPLRAILTAALRAWKDDKENYHHLEINYDPPEMPDSHYY